MLRNRLFTALILGITATVGNAFAQGGGTVSVKPSVITGEVASVDATKIVVTSAKGPVEAVLNEKTSYKRVSPDRISDPTAATPAALTDISVGDKLMVTGILSSDGKTIPAKSVYLMTKADISKKNAKEAEEWRLRGIAGKVLTVNEQTNQINVEVRSLTGATTNVTLTPARGAIFKRYAPDSIRFDEALSSSLSEVRAGDMIRAKGDKSSDGTAITADEVVTGSFQTIAGTVKSIDEAKNEVVIKNLQTGKDVTVVVTDISVLKKFPADVAERMAGAQASGWGGGGLRPLGNNGNGAPGNGAPGNGASGNGAPGNGAPGNGAPGNGAPGNGQRVFMMGGGRPGSGGGGSIDDMVERFPNIKVADLKAGDIIALSSSKGTATDRIKAIKLLAGVEPFLRMAQAQGGRNGGGRNGVDGSFSIPGLDGIGFP
ncbi:MAG: hypothetical protein JO053_15650 [Acidobacteria bacterium]|nr:hypothetical protein [Acidobacteriota bacterium]